MSAPIVYPNVLELGVEPEVILAVLGADLRSALVLAEPDLRLLGAAEALELLASAVRVALERAGL